MKSARAARSPGDGHGGTTSVTGAVLIASSVAGTALAGLAIHHAATCRLLTTARATLLLRTGQAAVAATVLAGVLGGVLAWRIGAEPVLAACCWIAALAPMLAVIDLLEQRLPDALTLGSYPVLLVLLAAAAVADGEPGALLRAVVTMAALAGFYAALAVSSGGVGMGDIKLVRAGPGARLPRSPYDGDGRRARIAVRRSLGCGCTDEAAGRVADAGAVRSRTAGRSTRRPDTVSQTSGPRGGVVPWGIRSLLPSLLRSLLPLSRSNGSPREARRTRGTRPTWQPRLNRPLGTNCAGGRSAGVPWRPPRIRRCRTASPALAPRASPRPLLQQCSPPAACRLTAARCS